MGLSNREYSLDAILEGAVYSACSERAHIIRLLRPVILMVSNARCKRTVEARRQQTLSSRRHLKEFPPNANRSTQRRLTCVSIAASSSCSISHNERDHVVTPRGTRPRDDSRLASACLPLGSRINDDVTRRPCLRGGLGQCMYEHGWTRKKKKKRSAAV